MERINHPSESIYYLSFALLQRDFNCIILSSLKLYKNNLISDHELNFLFNGTKHFLKE